MVSTKLFEAKVSVPMVLLAFAIAVPVYAQGRGGGNGGNGNSNGHGNGHVSSPPSSIAIPSQTIGPASAALPIAWLDDASLLPEGTMAITLSALKWSGADLGEVDFPIVNAALGVTRRFQIGASVPHVIAGADGTGAVGGVGTSYVSGKVALLPDKAAVKLAVSPTVQILGDGATQVLAPGANRAQFGLPVSLEVAQGPGRVFASTGFFSSGSWFVGGGAAYQATPKVGLSASFTRAWASNDLTGILRDRREFSGSLSYILRPRIGVYGLLGHTVATTDDNGAGTTIGGGITVLLTAKGKS